MTKRILTGVVGALLFLSALAFYAYERWGRDSQSQLDEVLSPLPAEATSVIYVDLDALRQSPFLAELYRWAPQTVADADYSQFMQSTGFNYERDLNRLGLATWKDGTNTIVLAVAQGNFDRAKISAYAAQSGSKEVRGRREIFSVPINGSSRRLSLTFLRSNLLALTDAPNLEALLTERQAEEDAQAWRDHFWRLAGSPIFAVIRQDAAPGATFGSRAPGGLRSPALSALLDQLQWITIAGKPTADHLRVVLEGESSADATVRRLADTVNGLLTFAQAGLSDPKMRDQLPPEARNAYLETLKSADVARIDRGDTKSVRLVFDLTPQFLEAARNGAAWGPAVPQGKPPTSKRTIRN